MVMVPLGMALPAGVQAKIDDNDPIKLKYTLCHVGGCTAAKPRRPIEVRRASSSKGGKS